jgi:opacity protein-like surface antigen
MTRHAGLSNWDFVDIDRRVPRRSGPRKPRADASKTRHQGRYPSRNKVPRPQWASRGFGKCFISMLLVAVGVVGVVPFTQAEGWYVTGSAGASFSEDLDASRAGLDFTESVDTGFLLSGALGYTYGPWRLEGEVVYTQNDIDTLSVSGRSTTANGDISTLAGMANAYFDLPVNARLVPYVGGGIGLADVSLNDLAADGVFVADDSEAVFALQVKAGITYQFSPQVEAMFGYRFFDTDEFEVRDSTGTPINNAGPQLHTIEASVRYRF